MRDIKRMFKIPILSLLIIVVIVFLLIVFQRSFIYVTGGSAGLVETSGIESAKEVYYVTKDGVRLYAWYKPAKTIDNKAMPTILYFHGLRSGLGFYASKFKNFASQGYGLMLTEYRGYGDNQGTPSEEGLINDARGALQFLENQGITANDIFFYGESLGGAVATALAAEKAPKGLILEAPFTSAVDVARHYWPHLPVELIMFDRFDANAKIGMVKAPVLMIQGEKDKKVPLTLGQKLFDSAKMPKEFHIIKEGGHENLYDFGADKIVEQWLVDEH